MLPMIDNRLLLILKEAGGRRHGSSVFDREKGAQLAYKGFWPRMESLTGIKMSRWRSFFIGNQGARSDMIEAAARLWPQYAFWLVTGITDATNGHISPATALAFPERLYADEHHGTCYFRQSLKLLDDLLSTAKGPDAIERRTLLGGKWWGGKLIDEAYALAASDEYHALQDLWNSREEEREIRKRYITGQRRPWLKQKDGSPKIKPSSEHSDPRTNHQDSWDLFYKPKTEGE